MHGIRKLRKELLMGTKKLFVTALTDLESTDIEGVSALKFADDGKVYQWLKNRNATAWTAKQPVCFDAGNVGSPALFKSANSPVAADLMLAAGIAMTAVGASGASCFGWVQRRGYFQDARVGTPATGGNDIEIGSELVAVDATTALAYQSNAGSAPIYSWHFRALETVATATGAAVVSKDVYIHCL
jgi:hypothetical protein